MIGSRAGSQTSWSMPLTMPTSRSRSATNTPSSPKPPFSVRSSCACVGLTVITRSEKTSPPLSRFTRPHHSSWRDGCTASAAARCRSSSARGSAPDSRRCAPRAPRGFPRSTGCATELGLQVDARQRRLPVVRVQDARRLRQHARQRHQHGAREQRDSGVRCRDSRPARPVEPGTVEVLLALDEHDARSTRLVRRRPARTDAPSQCADPR